MVIIYNIGIGKGDGKKVQETIESERPWENECEGGVQAEWGLMGSGGESRETEGPKEKMGRERKANKATKQAKNEQHLNVLKQKLSMTYLQIDRFLLSLSYRNTAF